MQTPTNGPVLLPDFQELEAFRHISAQQQHVPAIENRNLSSSYLPSSPLPRQPAQSNAFTFGFSSNDQFQTQLIHQLQNLNNTYHNQKCNNLYGQQLTGLYPQPQPTTQNAAGSPSFRISQASSYSSSPIQSHGSNESSSKTDSRSRSEKDDSHLIKPLSQGETITTTDGNGRLRVIIPVNEDDIPVPRLEPPPSGHRRSKEASPTKLGLYLQNTSFYSL